MPSSGVSGKGLDKRSEEHILADIGGTNTRFAISSSDHAQLQCIEAVPCSEYRRFEDALEAYIKHLDTGVAPKVASLCIAVAAAVHKDRIKLTNHSWEFSRKDLAAQFALTVHVLNDFSAQAYLLTELTETDVMWIQRPESFRGYADRPGTTCAVVGPGTGFGGTALTAGGEVLESEPGHLSFAPVTEHETELLKILWQRFERISVEHLLSGPGLANLYWANATLQGSAESELSAPQIVAAAKTGEPLALATMRDFTGILGSVCGDFALMTGSLGGFYLSGDMLGKMGALFDLDLFVSRFRDKGAFRDWCADIPVARITAAYPGLRGCAAYIRGDQTRGKQTRGKQRG